MRMFSQTTEYALRAMVVLASNPPDSTKSSEVMAQQTKVPRHYLSKILRDLSNAKLVIAQRGPSGGFQLSRSPDRISILDVVNAVDPLARIHECPLGNPMHVNLCPLHRRLDDAMHLVEQTLAGSSLAQLRDSDSQSGQSCGSLCQKILPPSTD